MTAFLEQANEAYGLEVTFFEPRLTLETCRLAMQFTAVCVFVNDRLNAAVLEELAIQGVRILTFPNGVVTGHQAFFTQEALQAIAQITLQNLRDIETTGASANEVSSKLIRRP